MSGSQGRVPLGVGDPVVLKGTGRHWRGVNYNATVVDVRPSDDSIKVRYADGGYKRFPSSEFYEVLVEDSEDHYQLRAYELYAADTYDPTAEVLEEVGSLRERVQEAVRAKNFLEADRLKRQISDHMRGAEELRSLRRELQGAVQKEDFLAAHEIQLKINARQKALVAEGKPEASATDTLDIGQVVQKAMKRAMGGGAAGAMAMVLQVTSLMWMRTTMNYQYRYGMSTREAMKTLYQQGGVRRFYRGIGPALFQGPLSRFGDTAANTGVLALLNAFPETAGLPVGVKTFAASLTAASWRIMLMPIDTVKTTLQVEGKDALQKLRHKASVYGPRVYYHGALAASTATFAGHFPWFFTYNFLDEHLPKVDGTLGKLGRNAFMGFSSSVVSDTVSNSIRVVKTYRQTSEKAISYPETVRAILAEDGLKGLLGRGLQTRILANGMQGLMFSVLWKMIDEKLFR